MFKNATIYAIAPDWAADLTAMEQSLSSAPFRHCGPTDAETFGFVPPRGPAGALVESINGQRITCFQLETKSVPASAVKRELDKRTATIEAETGRKPGRKATRELKEQITFDLLPHAFPKTARVLVWFDLQHRRLVLDTASQNKADTATTALTLALSGLHLSLLDTSTSPQAAMTQWLAGEDDAWPTHFAPGHEVELKADDGSKATVKFDRHHLDDQQMRLHIEQGKLPTRLGLDWEGRVGFVLTEGLQLRKIAFLDGVVDEHTSAQDGSGFDADAAIATAELGQLITDLIAALGSQVHH
ncbi:MAG: recombination-associated protein RdgC [Macromonas sp.]